MSQPERENLWTVVRTDHLGILRGASAVRAQDHELVRRSAQVGVYDPDYLSALLSTEGWMREALADDSGARRLDLASRSWLLVHRGFDSEAVNAWVSDMDERLRRPLGRSVLGASDTYSVELLEAVLELAPDSAARWILSLSAADEIGYRLADLEFGLVDALMVALVNREDSRALVLVKALERGAYFVQRTQEKLALPLRSKRTEMARRVLLHVLGGALNDNVLQLLCRLAEEHQSTQWLQEVAATTHVADRAFERARSIGLLGLGPGSHEVVRALRNTSQEDSTWIRHVADWALRQNQSDLWARHWFRAFLERPRRVEAWAAFRLFFACRSRLSGLWIHEELDRARNLPDQEARLRHLHLNLPPLNRRLDDKAKEMEKRLFGWSIPAGDLKPWKEMWSLR